MTIPRRPRPQPGDGLVVVDAGTGLVTALAARLLAHHGATVYSAERSPAIHHAAPALNRWQARTTVYPRGEEHGLLNSADVVFVGGEDHPDEGSSLSAAEARRGAPRAVVIEVSGYAEGLPDQTPAVELLVQARLGLVWEHEAGRPVELAFGPAVHGAALQAALGAWAGLLERERSGVGTDSTVTLQQGLAIFWSHLWMTAERPDADFDNVPPLGVRHMIFRCADGNHVQLVLGVRDALRRLYLALDLPVTSASADRGRPSLARGPEHYFAHRTALEDKISTLTREDVIKRLRQAGLPVEAILAPTDCVTDPQVGWEKLFEVGPDGDLTARVPLDGELVPAAPRLDWRGAAESDRPLRGIRVLDLGNWVAGPFASKLLADLGADVISVDPPEGLFNLTGIRNTIAANRGKRNITLDLKSPDAQQFLHRLVRTVHVVHHNLRPGVAARLGADVKTLRTYRPDLIHLHLTAYGTDGPRAGEPGFDMVAQALTGHEHRAGGEGNEPLWYRAPFVDYAAGALGAIATVAALVGQERSGDAADLRVSLLGAGLFIRGETVRHSDGTVTGPTVLSADRGGFTPAESLYGVADGWVAVAARGDAMAARLRAALDLRPAGHLHGWGDTERVEMADAFATMNAAEALARLERADVWAVECQRPAVETFGTDHHWRLGNFVADVADHRFGKLTGIFGPQITLRPAGRRPAPDVGPVPGARATGHRTNDLLDEVKHTHPDRSRPVDTDREDHYRKAPSP